MTAPLPEPRLSERLRERTALKYMGDCKCGHCQLVARADLVEAVAVVSEAERQCERAVILDEIAEAMESHGYAHMANGPGVAAVLEQIDAAESQVAALRKALEEPLPEAIRLDLARAIGATASEVNHMVRADECWRVLSDRLRSLPSPIPEERTP